ncbi:MAG: Lrp/AsnC family transcriptional regulator [Pseudoclavibacter sp.]|nr:Lrp/AsnC family transcriptional regulator [Pseudoclavibacter sp.]
MDLDRTDRAIIDALRANARLSMRALAERVHLSRTATHARVQRLVEGRVITGFTAVIRPEALGLHINALVIVTVTNEPWPDIERQLGEIPYVERVQAVSGDIDFVLTVRAPDHAALSETIMRRIQRVPGVTTTRSHIVLDEYEEFETEAPAPAED